jgi:Zn finger protein HypA/HybF involved in hydrogenase expression
MILVTKTCHKCSEKFQGNGYDYSETLCPKCKEPKKEKTCTVNDPFKIIGSRWEGK